MSTWPLLSVLVFFCLLVGIFLWLSSLVLVGLVVGAYVLFGVVSDIVLKLQLRFRFAFFLFLFSEGMIFLALLTSVLWFEEGKVSALSSWDGIPLVGCVLLISSSFAASLYHNSFLPGFNLFRVWLGYAILFGCGFVFLQLIEFWDCRCDLLTNAYYAASYCAVGLHFIHVVLGLLVLGFVCWFESSLSLYHVDLAIWYWHFVDYIWLVVFLVVYIL